jgi:ABC-type oligopeptide transport system substrate-binding subunit
VVRVRLYKARQQPTTKGVKNKMRVLKAIMIVAVLASALSLGACAQKKEETTTGTTAASTRTYSK